MTLIGYWMKAAVPTQWLQVRSLHGALTLLIMERATREEMANVVKDMCDYYSADPEKRRGLNTDGGCVYDNEQGGKCAVGRLLSDQEIEAIKKAGQIDSDVAALAENMQTDEIISIAQFPIVFLELLQDIHDAGNLWKNINSSKASLAARKAYLLELIELGEFDNSKIFRELNFSN